METNLVAKTRATNDIKDGDQTNLCLDMSKVHFFDKEITNVIK